MKFELDLFKTITECYGPSGREAAVAQVIQHTIRPYCEDVVIDEVGNVIAHVPGHGKKIVVCAHMDQVAVAVIGIDDQGMLQIGAVGALNTKMLIDQRLRFQNGIEGVVQLRDEASDKAEPTIKDLYLDIGCSDRSGAKRLVNVGDMCIYTTDTYCHNGIVMARAVDDRIGCYILVETIKNLATPENDLYFVFSTQEEISSVGASYAVKKIRPDVLIAVDTTATGDNYEGIRMKTAIGKGAAIKVRDNGMITEPSLQNFLIEIATKHQIPYQLEILPFGGTDASASMRIGGGIKSGAISVATRNLHGTSEVFSTSDAEACIALMTAFLQES